ncbi:MAG: NAD-dependent epimerase/dehydratase family protein [Caldilineaceae bacterium]
MPNLTSVYALSKYNQEQMCLIVGRSYDISTVGLRFFNTYGPRQALSNPTPASWPSLPPACSTTGRRSSTRTAASYPISSRLRCSRVPAGAGS